MPIVTIGPCSGRRRQRRIELADAVGSGLGRMEEGDNLLLGQSRLDPGESGCDQPGFARHGERIEGGTFEQLRRSGRPGPPAGEPPA